MYRDESVISSVYGDIDYDLNCEKVRLIGIQQDKNSPYITSLKLIIEAEGKKLSFEIDMEGYEFKLFLGDFLNIKSEQILISGQYGGYGGHAIFRIYQFKNNKLKLILDDEALYRQINCSAEYLDDYNLSVSCKDTNTNYKLDISKNFKGYLDLVYDDGKAIKGIYPTVSKPNTIYPIMYSNNNYYYLQIQQRIIGVSNGDILGAIQSVIKVNDKGKISVKEQYYLLINTDDMWTKLPIGADIISLNKFGGQDDVIEVDLNNDGINEVIFAYKYSGEVYIIVGKYDGDKFIVIDTYKKMGLDISHLEIKQLLDTNNKIIIVGFKIRSVSSSLGLLVFEDLKLKDIIEGEDIYFGKMDVKDLNNDGIYEIVLWTHDTGEVYIMNIYELVNNEFKKTDKYNEFHRASLVLNMKVWYYLEMLKQYISKAKGVTIVVNIDINIIKIFT